jgi:hypothetical protein
VTASGDDDNGTDSGSVRVFSGATGLPLYTVHGATPNAQLSSVTGGADFDCGRAPDLVIGSPQEGCSRVHQPLGPCACCAATTGATLDLAGGFWKPARNPGPQRGRLQPRRNSGHLGRLRTRELPDGTGRRPARLAS